MIAFVRGARTGLRRILIPAPVNASGRVLDDRQGIGRGAIEQVPRHRRLVADIDAEYLEAERYGPHLALWRTQLVVGRAQQVIVWRLRRDEATVERACRRTPQT